MGKMLGRISDAVLRSAPLFPVAVGMIAGVVLDRSLLPGLWVYPTILVLCSGVVVLRAVRAVAGAALVFAASVCVGGALHVSVARTSPRSSIDRYVDTGDAPEGTVWRIARVRGTVVSEPRLLGVPPNPFARWTYGAERTAFVLDAESIESVVGNVAASGRLRVTIDEPVLDLRENERVELFGRLRRLEPPRNPGSFDWSAFWKRQGIVATLRCNHRENVRRLDADPPRRRALITRLRTKVRGLLTDDLVTGADEEASLLEAMVLGHRSRLDRRLNDIFIRAGCVHFLAVSGTHIVIVLSFVWLVARVLVRARRQCAWWMLVAVGAYALIAEPRPPILRASLMAALLCASILLRHPRARLNWISAAAVILLVFRPLDVFDVGFQLSFAAVLGVSYLTPALWRAGCESRDWLERVVLRRPFAVQDRELARQSVAFDGGTKPVALHACRMIWRSFLGLAAVSIGAWLAGVPIVAAHFSRVQPWGPVSSVLVFPFVYVVMILGMVKIAMAGVAPALAPAAGEVVTLVDGWLINLVELLASLPGATLTVTPPPWWLVGTYYLCLLGLVWRFQPPRARKGEAKRAHDRPADVGTRWPRRLSLALLVTFVAALTGWRWQESTADRTVVTVLSVGAGAATVIELPDGRTVLYDAGSRSPGDVGRSVVVPYLRRRGIRRIDRVYISHPNLDHFSGLPTIVEENRSAHRAHPAVTCSICWPSATIPWNRSIRRRRGGS
jgi:competence protein ComEC